MLVIRNFRFSEIYLRNPVGNSRFLPRLAWLNPSACVFLAVSSEKKVTPVPIAFGNAQQIGKGKRLRAGRNRVKYSRQYINRLKCNDRHCRSYNFYYFFLLSGHPNSAGRWIQSCQTSGTPSFDTALCGIIPSFRQHGTPKDRFAVFIGFIGQVVLWIAFFPCVRHMRHRRR